MTAISRLRGSQRQVRNTYQSDRMAVKFLCDLKTADTDSDELHPGIRYCTHVTQVAGAQPSYAYVGVPVNTWSYEQAPTVALQASGPAGKTRLRTRARIKYVNEGGDSVDLLSGFIVKYDHSINEDSVVATVFDDRWTMSKITVAGRATYDPQLKKHYYDMSQPAIFNRDGMQDCLDTPHGPRFAPSRRYGYGATSDSDAGLYQEPRPGSASLQARSWRCRDIAAYLRAMHTADGAKPSSNKDYGNLNLPRYVVWPNSFGTDTFFDRVPRALDLQNKTLLEALNILCRRAGPFDIWIKPVGFFGHLQLVRCDIRRSGQYLYLPKYMDLGIDDALQNSSVVQGGALSESIINYFDETCICGDPPAVERMFSTANQNTSLTTIPEALEAAWSSQDETAFKSMVTSLGDTEDAFKLACERYPLVYAAWRFSKAPKVPVWSTYSKWGSSANLFPPRFLPMLLSAFSGGTSSNPRDWQRMPISVEYYDEQIEEWVAAERFDGLEVHQDGSYLFFPGLRARLQTFQRSGYDGDSFAARNIRLTAAAHTFFRMTAINRDDPNHTEHRINHNGCRFTYLVAAEDEDYVDWERETSYPIGTGSEGLSAWPDRVGNGSELFTDDERIDKHAKHRQMDVRRIEYSGNVTLQRFNPGIKPGDPILVQGGGIVPWGVVRAVTWDADTQIQTVEMMAADQSTIYDIPTGGAYTVPQPAQPSPKKPNIVGGDSPDETWNEQKYQEEMKKADSTYTQKEVASTGASRPPSAPTPVAAEKGGSTSDRELLELISRAGASEKAPQQAVGRGKIITPEQSGWNKSDAEWAEKGIVHGEELKQRDHEKNQRMEEGITGVRVGPSKAKAKPSPKAWASDADEEE